MDLRAQKSNWERFAEVDPMWAILSRPDKRWNRWSVEEFFASGEGEIRELMAALGELPAPLARQRALDFGCGIGRATQALAAHFEECVGLDISEQMLEQARKHNRHGDRCRYLVNEGDRLPGLETSSFDLVYTNLVLQHIENRFVRSYLEEFLRILRPGGVLVCQIPSRRRDATGTLLARWRQLGTRGLLRATARRLHLERTLRRATRVARYALGKAHLAPLLYRWRVLQNPAVMEMHPFDRDELEAFLRDRGARIIRVDPNNGAGPEFEGFRYFVTRPDDGPA